MKRVVINLCKYSGNHRTAVRIPRKYSVDLLSLLGEEVAHNLALLDQLLAALLYPLFLIFAQLQVVDYLELPQALADAR